MTHTQTIRINSIDMCRGLLFVLMANTHALGLARIDSTHWVRSDLWLPNGWATIVFVVLSGYAAGYLLSNRTPESRRDQLLRKRAFEILAVMFVSNIIFAVLREIARGDTAVLLQAGWYWGFLGLTTEWTISGVLLPTALVLFAAPFIMRAFKRFPRWLLAGLLICHLGVSLFTRFLMNIEETDAWTVKFFLISGFGGFPVFPFLLNGCLGIWIGMSHKRNPDAWLPMLILLGAIQLTLYLAHSLSASIHWSVLLDIFGAVGKFGWVFLTAITLVRILPSWSSAPIELVGRFALGSFVMHRVFMQAIALVAGVFVQAWLGTTSTYLFLFLSTMFLTWLLCRVRSVSDWTDAPFKALRI